MVVAVVFTALDTPPNERFSVLPSGEEGELIKESPEKREKRARQELETLYGMKREIPCEGSFRRMRNAISLKGPRAGTEVIVSELQSQDMEKIGLKRFQASRIIDQRRMLNWLFRPKPNVAEVLEVIVTPLTYIYVTEALPGPSLMDLLVSDEKQSYRRIAELLRQILTAVASLHHSRLIHRDLKPESFSFDKSGALKLTDVCGMVCHLSESYEAEFEQGIICGTLAYMSPEALVGCARQSSDMWAVGVILHLMLIGVLPFHVSTIAQAVEAHRQSVETLKGQFKELWADVPREGQELVERLLQRNVRNRITVDQALKHPFLVHADTGLALANNKALKHPVLVHAETGLALANKKVPSPMEEGPLTSLRRVVSLGLIHEAYSHCKASGESKVSWAASVEAELKPVSKTLYLIRHGEAIHNIEEKRAKRRAAEAALAAGIKRGTKEFEEAVEAARKSVLQNPDFYDAMLSHAGLLDAERCKCELAGLFERGLPMPTAILTSPLQRTLQTASAIFPYHSNVHVREDVRERRTLLPCDTRSRASDMSSRPSFRQLDFNGVPDLDPNEDVAEDSRALRMRCAKFLSGLPSMSAVDATGFDRHHDSICVVTHKGFLRELERGPLGHPESSEFNNCEVRVYLLVWKPNGEIETPAKCIYSNASLSTVQMRNFPVSWVAPDALEALPRRVEALLSDFGELRQPPEVSEDPGGGIRVTAVFTEQSAAAAAALKLNGVDCRCEDEKKARPTAYEADRFCVQVLYDIL